MCLQTLNSKGVRMARRQFNYKMLDASDISTNSDSAKTNVEGVDEATIFVNWAGTSPVGTITIEASNSDSNDFATSLEVWNELDFGSAISVSGNTGDHQINFTSMPFKYIRFRYAATSGTGALTARINATSIGA